MFRVCVHLGQNFKHVTVSDAGDAGDARCTLHPLGFVEEVLPQLRPTLWVIKC